MQASHLRSSAVCAAFLCFTVHAAAQQQPGSNVPTPVPAPAGGTTTVTTSAPILQEPVIDPRTYSSSLPNTPLLVTGMVLFGASYGASAIAAGVSNRDSDEKLYYPVVGPWMALNDRDCNADPCSRKTLGTTLLVGSGVVQGLGALGMVLSLMIPKKTTHDWYLIGDETHEHLLLTPMAGSSELGAFAVGRF
jgi:hypothetical protein